MRYIETYLYVISLKPPEHGLGINMRKNLNYKCIPKKLNNCVIEHTQ